MVKFIVDENKCIHCGLCVKDCIEYAIELNNSGIPQMTKPDMCISCQHCFAICPKGAITFNDNNAENSFAVGGASSEDTELLIKSRRSDRQYKPKNVDENILKKLKDILKWVPTGCNYHKLQFSFIDNIDVMNDFRNKVNAALKHAIMNNPDIADKFGSFKETLVKGEDLIFRGAPHLLVVSNEKNAPCAQEDGIIALSYFELYAQALGLGTCWCGFMKSILKFFPDFLSYFELPQNYEFCYAILFGEKAVKYQRTTQPDEVIIRSISKK